MRNMLQQHTVTTAAVQCTVRGARGGGTTKIKVAKDARFADESVHILLSDVDTIQKLETVVTELYTLYCNCCVLHFKLPGCCTIAAHHMHAASYTLPISNQCKAPAALSDHWCCGTMLLSGGNTPACWSQPPARSVLSTTAVAYTCAAWASSLAAHST